MGEFTRGRMLGLTLAIVALLAGIAALTGHLEWSPLPERADDPLDDWIEVLAWDFADGEFPGGWGWGKWRFVDGTIELDGRGEKDMSVYFTPAVHDRDFVMEADVQLLPDEGGLAVRAHLLTRDSNRMNHESGIVLTTAPDKVAVRHMVNEHNHILELVPSPVDPSDHGWHHLEFMVIGGLVSARIDGDLVYESDEPTPAGYYTEPHLATERGVARFRNIRIRSSSGTRPGHDAADGNAEAEG